MPGFDRVRLARLPAPSRRERLTGAESRLAIRHHAAAVDVAHLHGVWEMLLPAAAAELRRAGVPYLVTPHGMLHPWSLRQRWLKKRLALALVHGRMIRRAAALHTLNDDDCAALERLRFGVPIHVIPNGVWPAQLDPPADPEAFRRACPALGEHPYVLFLSRLHFKKGLDLLIDAFGRLPVAASATRLVIAGPDFGARCGAEQQARRTGVADRILFVGPVYDEVKRAALHGAACFCLPSRQEGFPVAVLEALAAGVPAVISHECYMPDVAEAGAGHVVPLVAATIGAALAAVLSDPVAARRMGEAGRQLVRSRYMWPQIADRFDDLFVGIVEPNSASRVGVHAGADVARPASRS